MIITTPRRLRLTVAALVLGCSIPIRTQADPAPLDVAREHFRAGVRHLQDPDGARYEDAYREFRAAYAASPSPKILGNIGFCAMKLERDGEAIEAYQRYLAEVSDIDPDEREQIAKDLQTMQSGVVRLSISVKGGSGAITILDTRTPTTGTPVVNAYPFPGKELTIGLRPGRHSLRARTAGSDESKTWELDATPGSKSTHVFEIVHASEPVKTKATPVRVEDPPSRVAPWLLTATGGVMLVTAGVTGLLTLNKVSQLESRCPNDTCPAGYGLDAERDSIKRLSRVTDVLLIGGAVVTTTGIVWLFASGSAPKPESGKDGALARPDLACSTVGCSFTFTGRF